MRHNFHLHTGPQSALSSNQEKRLANYLKSMAMIGYGLTKKDIRYTVKSVLDKADQEKTDAGLPLDKKNI